jgi:hypothetical protein
MLCRMIGDMVPATGFALGLEDFDEPEIVTALNDVAIINTKTIRKTLATEVRSTGAERDPV